jgi:flagellar hook-associated protein 1 FlgK
MSLVSTLEKALTGLRASQAGIDIVSRNLSNVNTPGYTRKFQQLQPQTFDGVGAGVEQLPEARFVDRGVERQFREEFSINERLKVLEDFLTRFEDTFGAPNLDISIANEITKLGDTFRSLAEKPDSVTAQTAIIAQAQQVARVLNLLSQSIQNLRGEADRQTKVSIDQVNTSLARVEELNGQIGTRFAQGQASGDLEDLRDIEVEKIAKEIQITYFIRGNNELVILTEAGRSLLEGARSTLSFTATSNVASTDIYTTGAVPAGLNNTLSAVTLAGVDITAEIRDGRVGGYLELRDTRLTAAGTTGMQAVIDALASQMTLSFFNPQLPVASTRQLQLFQDTSGQYDPVATPGQNRGYAGRILVNPTVVANPWRTRDGTVVAAEETNDRGDATIPLGIVDMFENTATFTSGIAAGVNALIGQVIEVRERAEYQDNVTNAIDQRRKNPSGVNPDQELALMIQLQNSYNASARIIQTVQEMYDSLFRISP